ncbi:MAG TPA: acyl-CoA ligase (AMP-forming), exosortase A system-associated [Allosphingosinicella sp.]|jgi:acyl-CoA ligase (AMP-forming) (exosortase A-associated)
METIATFLDRAAASRPESPALIHGTMRITFGDLAKRVDGLAANFRSRGLPPLARVAVYREKSIDMVVAVLAAMKAGMIAVPINPKLKLPQVLHIVSDCEPSLFFTTAHRAGTLAPHLPAATALLTEALPNDEAACPAQAPKPIVDADPAIIFYTSGSTGQPKGVVASHRNLVAGATSVNAYLGTHSDDVIMAVLPLSFDAGFSQITTALHAGSCVVLHEYLRPLELIKLCAEHKVTSMTAIPPLWVQLAGAVWPPEAAESLRLFANTGGHMPTPLLQKLRSLFPRAAPFLMYGLTEAFRSTYLDPREVDVRPNSIGKAIPNAEVLVLREDGSECGPDEPGELVHRGAHVCLGYWRDPGRTAEKFRPRSIFEGAFAQPAVWSGDIVTRDEEGFLYFVSRRDEMIKTSGYRVSPSEVEQAILALHGISEAVVFGVADPDLGQRIVGVVRKSELDEADLPAHLRRVLPAYMVPQIVAIEALPRNPNGKLDRPRIKADYVAGLVAETVEPLPRIAAGGRA